MSELTGTDWAGYAGLLAMASLGFLVIDDNRQRALLALPQFYGVHAAVGVLLLRVRRGRS